MFVFAGALLPGATMNQLDSDDLFMVKPPRVRTSKEWLEPQPLPFVEVQRGSASRFALGWLVALRTGRCEMWYFLFYFSVSPSPVYYRCACSSISQLLQGGIMGHG